MQIIGYIRVSTQKQGQSGLGLEAQLSALEVYRASVRGKIVHAYREIESGTDSDRPELAKAIAHAKRVRGKLVIAKLDRLARNVHFISGLMESGVDFVNAEAPGDDRFVTHVKAAMAEEEARKISERTKAALAAAKRRGVRLGSARPGHWDGREDRRKAGSAKGLPLATAKARAKRLEESEPVYREAAKIVRKMRDEGASLREIAKELNSEGFTTARGAAWTAMQVSRLIAAGFAPIVAVAVAITSTHHGS